MQSKRSEDSSNELIEHGGILDVDVSFRPALLGFEKCQEFIVGTDSIFDMIHGSLSQIVSLVTVNAFLVNKRETLFPVNDKLVDIRVESSRNDTLDQGNVIGVPVWLVADQTDFT